MKFFTLAAIAAVQATPTVQESNMMWGVEGFKGFYDGYYKSFYKKPLPEGKDACLNEETVENMTKLGGFVSNPIAAFSNLGNVQEDFNMFTEISEVFENLASCRFEESVIDITKMCLANPDDCLMPKLTENFTKNMFVLVGKMTSLAETMQNFPAKDNSEFREQMKEFGEDAGTALRIVFNYHS